MKSLIAQWISKKVPIFNGLIQANGRAFHVRAIDPPRHLPLVLNFEDISELPFDSEDIWTSVFPVAKVAQPKTGYMAFVGECGMGGDGFVALQKDEFPQSLQWIAFFDFSNPFESVCFEGNTLVARNSLGEDWIFCLPVPSQIVIRKMSN